MGSSYDIALAASFFPGLEREWLHGRTWTSKSQARTELFDSGTTTGVAVTPRSAATKTLHAGASAYSAAGVGGSFG